jgi:hypothetical protein
MTLSPNSVCKPPDDDPIDGSVAVHISHVHLSIAQKATAKTVPIPSILHKIMNKIIDADCTTIFHDIIGKNHLHGELPRRQDHI